MSNAKAQHQLVGTLVEAYPELTVRMGELVGARHPHHDQLLATSNTHPMQGGAPIETDTTVSMLREGKPRFFAQVEMQNEYSPGKVATLRAYHGSEVRKSRCGGRVYVVSPRESVAARFRAEEERRWQELAFDVRYVSSADLAPMGAGWRPYPDRALAVAVTDFRNGLTDRAKDMLAEMGERQDDFLANLLLRTILEECPDDGKLEEAMSDIAMERLYRLPAFQDWLSRATAKVREELEAKADARVAAAEARAAEAGARAAAEAGARVAEARRNALVPVLNGYFMAKGENLSPKALAMISACSDEAVLQSWLMRAYHGESASQIFPEPESSG